MIIVTIWNFVKDWRKACKMLHDALADYLEKLSRLFSSAALLTLTTILKRL